MRRNIGVVGCVVYRPGQQMATKWGANALEWLFDPQNRFGFPDYFREASGGLIEINAQVYPTFFWESAELVDVIDRQDRKETAERLWDTTYDQGIDLGMFDGTVFFLLGRPFNAGAAYVNRDGIQRIAVLSDEGTHAFFAHEIGHVLGLDHPFLLTDERSYKHGEYADPTCVMSAENYGGRPVTFALAQPPTGNPPVVPTSPVDQAGVTASTIDRSARLWAVAGPGISAATLWRFMPGFPAAQPWVRMLSPNDPAVPVGLSIPASPSGTRLAAMPDLFGAGWYTAELRSSAGWDRAFKTAAAGDQDVVFAAGVVIHSIADVGVAEDGPGWPKDNRVCYEGTIPVPSTGNDDWTNGLFSARVTGPKGSGLLVGRTLPPLEAVRLEVMGSMPTTTTVPGPSTEAVLIGPSCGKGTLETELHTTTLHITVIAAANGFLAPAFRFTLNDQPIGAWARVIVPVLQSSITPVTVRLERPVAYDERITQTAVVMITWQIQGNRLVLEIPGGDGRFTLTVGVSVGDATLPNPIPRATAVETFDLVTAGIGLTESSREAVQQCASYLGSWRLAQPIGPEDPLPPIALPDDWTSLDRESLVHALGNLQTLIETNARVATDVVADIGSQLGVRPATLMQAMRRLPREPHG